jgi:3-dehydroquinate synthase
MGYVDAAVGIKTGINFDGSKNRLGSFHPPVKVLLDKAFLKTLSKRHILNGVSEMIKLAIIKDAGLFKLLESEGARSIAAYFQDEGGTRILGRAISGLVDDLQPNLFEDDLARRMDFGHTFSYGLETQPASGLLHGEAVLLDIAVSVILARGRGLLTTEEAECVFNLFQLLGMELTTEMVDASLLWQSLEERTLHRNGLQKIPLPHGIGGCIFVNDVTLDELESTVALLKNRMVTKDDRVREH